MKVVCKMVVVEKRARANLYAPNAQESAAVVLRCATGPGNESWSRYTPSGSVELEITNPQAFDAFKLGRAYLVTFELAADAAEQVAS